jgi:ferredoxin
VSAPPAGWRLTVDPDTCIGSGMCAGIAPALFALAGGVAVPVPGPVPPDPAAIDAAESCPVEAIAVRDDPGGRLIAPAP